MGVGGVLLGVARHLIDRLSDTFGISYGANLVFAGVFIFLLVVCINLSMHVSKLEDEVATLAEELALVNGRLDALVRDDVDLREQDEPHERPLGQSAG